MTSIAIHREENIEQQSETFRRYLKPDIMEIIDVVNEIKMGFRPSVIARALNESIDKIKKKLAMMKNHGLRIVCKIDHYRMGLLKTVVFSKNTGWEGYEYNYLLKSYFETISPSLGAFYVIYTPIAAGIEADEMVYLLDPEFYFVTEITVYPRPKYKKYFDFTLNEPVNNFRLVEERFRGYIESIVLPELRTAKILDWLDLLIVKELEKNALLNLSDIAFNLSVALGRNVATRSVRKHYHSHVIGQGLIQGATFAYSPFPANSSMLVALVTEGSPKINYALARAFSETFMHRGSLISRSSRMALHLLILPNRDISEFTLFLRNIEDVFENTRIFIANRLSAKSWTIPFLAFDQEERWWSLESMERMMVKYHIPQQMGAA